MEVEKGEKREAGEERESGVSEEGPELDSIFISKGKRGRFSSRPK